MKNLPTYDEYLITEKKYEKEIKSTHLVEMRYDSDTEILEVDFHDGSTYQYSGVPKSVYKDLAQEKNVLQKIGGGIANAAKKLFGGEAASEGTFGSRFWSLIRREDYPYKKIK
jgi:hypothetical protein